MADATKKYLVFSIANEHYGIPIQKVREVIRHEAISPVHNASEFLKGVINLRGKIIPIIDMRLKLGIVWKEYSDRTVFIIVDVQGDTEQYLFGIAVDAVHEVASIGDEDLDHLPDVGFRTQSAYLQGVAKLNQTMVIILNMDRILNTKEIVSLAAADLIPSSS